MEQFALNFAPDVMVLRPERLRKKIVEKLKNAVEAYEESNMENTITINKITLDSLIFFYFGFTLDEDFDYILNRIVEKAYGDATNQGAFNTKADSGKAQMAKYGENGSLSIMIERLQILKNENRIKFDEWHSETCDQLVKKYEENGFKKIFNYGNAQKWVNMSLKYIYLLNGISKNYAEAFLEETSKICRYSKEFHIPIDSYIIDELWRVEGVKLPFKGGVEKDRTYPYVTPSEYIEGWSNWHDKDYNEMRKSLCDRKKDDHMKWESEHWIKRAKERKRKNNKNK